MLLHSNEMWLEDNLKAIFLTLKMCITTFELCFSFTLLSLIVYSTVFLFGMKECKIACVSK